APSRGILFGCGRLDNYAVIASPPREPDPVEVLQQKQRKLPVGLREIAELRDGDRAMLPQVCLQVRLDALQGLGEVVDALLNPGELAPFQPYPEQRLYRVRGCADRLSQLFHRRREDAARSERLDDAVQEALLALVQRHAEIRQASGRA